MPPTFSVSHTITRDGHLPRIMLSYPSPTSLFLTEIALLQVLTVTLMLVTCIQLEEQALDAQISGAITVQNVEIQLMYPFVGMVRFLHATHPAQGLLHAYHFECSCLRTHTNGIELIQTASNSRAFRSSQRRWSTVPHCTLQWRMANFARLITHIDKVAWGIHMCACIPCTFECALS